MSFAKNMKYLYNTQKVLQLMNKAVKNNEQN